MLDLSSGGSPRQLHGCGRLLGTIQALSPSRRSMPRHSSRDISSVCGHISPFANCYPWPWAIPCSCDRVRLGQRRVKSRISVQKLKQTPRAAFLISVSVRHSQRNADSDACKKKQPTSGRFATLSPFGIHRAERIQRCSNDCR